MIAIVDDNTAVGQALVRLVQAAGFSARAYASGTAFLNHWQSEPPDCLLLDLDMPGLSGMEVQRSLKLASAQFPIIIITSYDREDLRERCMSAGAASYLCKPLDTEVLIPAISLALSTFSLRIPGSARSNGK